VRHRPPQVECHPHLCQQPLVDFCRAQGVRVVAYHPLGKPSHRAAGEPAALAEPAVCAIAERLGATPAQVRRILSIKTISLSFSLSLSILPRSFSCNRARNKLTKRFNTTLEVVSKLVLVFKACGI